MSEHDEIRRLLSVMSMDAHPDQDPTLTALVDVVARMATLLWVTSTHAQDRVDELHRHLAPVRALFHADALTSQADRDQLVSRVACLQAESARLDAELVATKAQLEPHLLRELRAKIYAATPAEAAGEERR